MKRVLTTRRRLARVRAIQLKAETLDLAVARTQLSRLEDHRSAIERLAVGSNPSAGTGIGGGFASAVELRQRLIAASHSLAHQVGLERATVAMHEARCLSADRNKQIADKLLDRANRAAERAMEQRRTLPPRRRNLYPADQHDDVTRWDESS